MGDLSLAAVLPQIFTGLVLGMIFVLLAIGLSLIFGLMTVVNFSHGALYMLGAYFTVFVLTYTRSFWLALVVAPILVGTLGLLIERFLIRRLYGRSPDDPLLLTFALSLVLIETAKLIWGKIGLTLDPPRELAGAVNLGFMAFPAYRLFVIGVTVVNFSHGALYMLGAYFTVFVLTYTRSFWLALAVAPILVGTLGLLVERFLIRRLYGRHPDDPLLLTFGLSLVLIETAKLIWGKVGLTLDPPRELSGAVNLGFMAFPAYRLFVIGVTVAVLIGLWAFVTRTNIGLIIRAGSRDPLMVRALGINLNRIWLLVFGIGCGLAGLAGALAGPMRGAYAEMGVTMVIESFVVVVVGGMGSLLGAVVAGIMIGQVVGITTFFAPKLAEIMVFVVMAVVLLVRPSGIFGEAGLME